MEVSMRSFRLPVTALVAVAILALPALTSAQDRHVVDSAALTATLRAHLDAQDADRAAVRSVLRRAEVVDIAGRTGFDLARIDAAVDTLSGSDLERAAAAAKQASEALVGGQSRVVISTTTIIIALLVVILLIVAID
jgi:hypothetical protein